MAVIVHRATTQKQAVEYFRQKGLDVLYVEQGKSLELGWFEKIIEKQVGIDFVRGPVVVEGSAEDFDDDDLNLLCAKFRSLTRLQVFSESQITDLGPLEKLKDLEIVFLDGDAISDFQSASKLARLRIIVLQNTQITDLSSLENCPLTNLDIQTRCKVKVNFGRAWQLERLHIHGRNCRISEICDVQRPELLVDIKLVGMEKFPLFSHFTNLESLKIGGVSSNQILDLSAFTCENSLQNVFKAELKGDISRFCEFEVRYLD